MEHADLHRAEWTDADGCEFVLELHRRRLEVALGAGGQLCVLIRVAEGNAGKERAAVATSTSSLHVPDDHPRSRCP